MKICVLTEAWIPIWGGGQEHILQIAKQIASKRDYYFVVLAPKLSDGKRDFVVDEKHSNGKIRIKRLGIKFVFPNFLGRIIYTLHGLYYMLRNEYDVYHIHTATFIPLLPLVKIFHWNSKTVFTLHGSGKEISGLGNLNKIFPGKWLSEFFLYFWPIDVRISVAKNSIYPKFRNKFIILGNGVDTKEFDKIIRTAKNPGIKILWLGRMDQIKGVVILVKAFIRIGNKLPKTTLTLIGSGPEKGKIEKLISQSSMGNKILIENPKFGKEKIQEFINSDIFVLPSLSEGFPLTPLEAFTAKMPVIASRVGDVQELVKDGINGYTIKPGDINDLANKISLCVKNPSFHDLGRRGYDLVKEKYSWARFAQMQLDIYNKNL